MRSFCEEGKAVGEMKGEGGNTPGVPRTTSVPVKFPYHPHNISHSVNRRPGTAELLPLLSPQSPKQGG